MYAFALQIAAVLLVSAIDENYSNKKCGQIRWYCSHLSATIAFLSSITRFDMQKKYLWAVCLWLIGPWSLSATPLHIAVASNFSDVLQQIAQQFAAETGQPVKISSASTGKLYAQITHGAPFDVFFAADSDYPQRLEQAHLAHNRFTYAIGQLVLWSPNSTTQITAERLKQPFDHLAIANPKLAPYGLAAQQVLNQLALWPSVQNRLVRGENIAQTFQFVHSGNVPLGFVAYAQIKQANIPAQHCWQVPQNLYSPIAQQAVQLSQQPLAAEFLAFVRTPAMRKLIADHGYRLPHAD